MDGSMSDNLSQHIRSFNKRWNVDWDATSSFGLFKNRLVSLIDKYFPHVVDKDILNRYAFLCGLPAPFSSTGRFDEVLASVQLTQEGLKSTIIFSSITDAQLPVQIAFCIENLLKAITDVSQSKGRPAVEQAISGFYQELKDITNATPSLQLRVSKTKQGIVTYPAGAKLLDDSLINDNLVWLQDYPESLNAFEQALSIYLSGDKPKFRNLIDNLRVAIEQLLRRILNNQKSLEKQSNELDDWLEKRGTHKQIRNLYRQLLFGPYAILQNDVAKHGDVELLPDEIEYLIYITGTFMRLIIQLRRSEA
jgi:hypothetical protein